MGEREKKKAAKPKCFLIGQLENRTKVQHWLNKYAVTHETFKMATSVSAKHILQRHFTQCDGEICRPVHKEWNTLLNATAQ